MRRKFSAQDQDTITQQYRDPEVTIATLADQYQVSVSTMQRFLKECFSTEDYSAITASKRSRKKTSLPLLEPGPLLATTAVEDPDPASLAQPPLPPALDPIPTPQPTPTTYPRDPIPDQEASFGEILSYHAMGDDAFAADDGDDEDEAEDPQEVDPDLAAALQAEFQDHPIVGDPEADLSDLDDEEDEDDEEDPDPTPGSMDPASEDVATLEVLNLDDLEPPPKCFAVIDRFQELATRPLKDFDHAGILPASLQQLRTLPLFDNHRVARRFSDVIRRGSSPGFRVIDFPGEWLFMVRSSLWERGITHILFDGQIYDLEQPDLPSEIPSALS